MRIILKEIEEMCENHIRRISEGTSFDTSSQFLLMSRTKMILKTKLISRYKSVETT